MTMTKTVTETKSPLTRVRDWMLTQSLDSMVLTVADRFQGEEMQACDRVINHLTGFPGSAGALVVTANGGGALIVDGRYTIKGQQVADQHGLELVDLKPDAIAACVRRLTPHGGRWAANVDVVSYDTLDALIRGVGGEHHFQPTSQEGTAQWWPTRPAESFAPTMPASQALAARACADKIAQVWQEGANAAPDIGAILISDPAEVAWCLNLRGSDTWPLTTFRARLLINGPDHVTLFCADVHASAGSQVKGVELTIKREVDLASVLASFTQPIWLCPAATPYAIVDALSAEARRLGASPVKALKAVKDAAEIQGMRDAHLADAAAMVRFLHWLENQVPVATIDEGAATDKLWALRQQVGAFAVSFDTISAVGENAALPHYRTTADTNRTLSMDEIYLVDSGGQYPTGTTDITRTLFFGTPPQSLVRQNTLVLMGHIDVARVRFPKGVTGHRLDTLARQHLWNAGMDYGHGTGHGVGAGLNVHEAPPTIAMRPGGGAGVAFEPGMIVSNEPGYYEAGSHGIRIECLQVCQPEGIAPNWLGFEVLTLVPIQSKLIDPDMLTGQQLAWLNQFHAKVLTSVRPLLTAPQDALVIDWLVQACKPLGKSS